MEGEVNGHGFSWTRNAVDRSVFDILSPELPCRCSGNPHDVSINLLELWPLKVGAVDIEGVLLPSGFEVKELSRGSVIFGVGLVARDILRDVGADSNLLRDVPVDEGVGVGCLCGVIV